MSKELIYNENAWKKLSEGVDKVADAVKITIGPRGHNVVLGRKVGSPTITNDGVTIAKEIKLEDEFENMGAQLMIEVASRANNVAGDGTTTATILGQAIFKQGLKNVVSGANAMAIKRGINKAVKVVVESIKKASKKVETKEDIGHVASVSANNDNEIGDLISEAMEKVGNDGIITVERSNGMDTYVDIVEGMQFDKGYISPYMVNNRENMVSNIVNSFILLTNKKISSTKDILHILEAVAATKKPLLIIAQDVEGEALATLVVNKLKGTLDVTAVKAPGFGDRQVEILEDLATLTGGKVITEELGLTLEKVALVDLGKAKKITVSKDDTTITEGAGEKEKIDERISNLKKEIESTEDVHHEASLKQRLASLTGGVAVMYAGAATETELLEKSHRIEDALQSTRAAIEEGIVCGGGVALVRAISDLKDKIIKLKDDEKIGAEIVAKTLAMPMKQIANNAGQEGSVIVQELLYKEPNIGFDAMTLKYVDMFEAGIVDPVKVTRSALQNAASIAGMLLTTGCLIADKKENNPPAPQGVPRMM